MCNVYAVTYSRCIFILLFFFFFSSRRRHTRYWRDWSSDVCSSDLTINSGRLRFSCMRMAPGRAILQGIDAKPVNLFFELTAFGAPKEQFQKGRSIYTAACWPVHRQSERAPASKFLLCSVLISELPGKREPVMVFFEVTARRRYCSPRRPELRRFQSASAAVRA